MNDTQKISNAFNNKMREWLDDDEFNSLIKKTKSQTDPNVCHTHDYCDANVIMDECFVEILGREHDCASQTDADIWNDAWTLSKQNLFGVGQ